MKDKLLMEMLLEIEDSLGSIIEDSQYESLQNTRDLLTKLHLDLMTVGSYVDSLLQ